MPCPRKGIKHPFSHPHCFRPDVLAMETRQVEAILLTLQSPIHHHRGNSIFSIFQRILVRLTYGLFLSIICWVFGDGPDIEKGLPFHTKQTRPFRIFRSCFVFFFPEIGMINKRVAEMSLLK